MAWTIFYAILLVAYLASWAYAAYHPTGAPETVVRLAGLVGLLAALAGALRNSSLAVYFLFQRLAIRLFPDTTGRWWFSARFDGEFAEDVVHQLCGYLCSADFRFHTRVETETPLVAELNIDHTLYLKMQFDPKNLSADAHLTLVSRVMEVSYGHAKTKLERQIIPFMEAVSDRLRPTNSSFELDVQFLKRNPFFAVYIAHLSPDQVQDYRVVLHVDANHPTGKADKVEITKQRVHVTAKSPHSFQSIAEQFVLLSPDLKMLRGGT